MSTLKDLIAPIVIGITVAVGGFLPQMADAAVIVVNNADHEAGGVTNGNCTLGEAIQSANDDAAYDKCTAGSGDDVIELQPNATYTFLAPWDPADPMPAALPDIKSAVTIDGKGSTIVRDVNAANFRILAIVGNTIALKNLTVSNGRITDGMGGAGITVIAGSSGQALTLDHVTLSGHYAEGGGTSALSVDLVYGPTAVTITDSVIEKNTTKANDTNSTVSVVGATLAIKNTTIKHNTDSKFVLYVSGTKASIDNVTFYQNKASETIVYSTNDSTLDITKTSFHENTAPKIVFLNTKAGASTIIQSLFKGNAGIGVLNYSNSATTIAASTFVGNKDTAISNAGPSLSIVSATIADNTAPSGSGGLFSGGVGKFAGLANTVLIKNTPKDCVFEIQSIVSLGYNIFAQDGGCPVAAGDIVTKPTDAVLAELVFDPSLPGYGFFPLPELSMAINTGAQCEKCSNRDQLNHIRDTKYDIGAIEAQCGDGFVHQVLGEACDDKNGDGGDGCDNTCHVEVGFSCSGSPSICQKTCGNGLLEGAEQCDDGKIGNGDGCSTSCTIEDGYSCQGIPSVCSQTCGNGKQDAPSELCDDGNSTSGDGCSGKCEPEAGYVCSGFPSKCVGTCGNGKTETNEKCDDSNLKNGDGCSDNCQVEEKFSCTGTPSFCTAICGDGKWVDNYEQCDDGNKNNGDGCGSDCKWEAHYTCQNNMFKPSQCSPTCGDKILLAGEECDDGNWESGDGCSATCKKEGCGNAVAEPDLKENCDAADLDKKDCLSVGLGFDAGTLACNADCSFNTSACTVTPKESCGDGVKNGTELCDKEDLGGKTCTSLGLDFESGKITCNADCTVNTSECVKPKVAAVEKKPDVKVDTQPGPTNDGTAPKADTGGGASGASGASGTSGGTTTGTDTSTGAGAGSDAAPASGGGGCSLIR